MRLSTIIPIALALASTAFALPLEARAKTGTTKATKTTKTQATKTTKATSTSTKFSDAFKEQVKDTIHQWLSDIDIFNNFVDTITKVTDPNTISSEAQTVLKAAKDEGKCLATLTGELTLDAVGQAAAEALPAKFAKVGGILQDIIDHPSNKTSLDADLATINEARCTAAIAQYGDVMQAAAKACNITAPEPKYPKVCETLKNTRTLRFWEA